MFETYENLSNPVKNTFSDICNKLLANSFLARDKKDNKDSYYFVISYKDLFVEFFSIINYELVINRDLGCIQVIQQASNNLVHLRKEESIVLLILRLLYQEKLIETSLNSNVVITVNDIHEQYAMLDIRKRITKTDLLRTLRMFKRFNLLENLGDFNLSHTQLVLYPTLSMALSTENIVEVFNTISKLNEEGDN